MIHKIWWNLSLILFDRDDLAEIIKPFMENIKNESINDEKHVQFLQSFSISQLEVLYNCEIINAQKFNFLVGNDENQTCNEETIQEEKEEENQDSNTMNEEKIEENQDSNTMNEEKIEGKEENQNDNNINNEKIEEEESDNDQDADNIVAKLAEIIEKDNVDELQILIVAHNIQTFSMFSSTFKNINDMAISLLHFCIIKKAIKCFKYLLVNGYDDPNHFMEELNPDPDNKEWVKSYQYEWDCMALAIYLGNMEIMKILEDKGIKKGNNSSHIEAAIFSYRNTIAKDIINEIEDKDEKTKDILNIGIAASIKKNNIKVIELLISKGADINAIDIIYLNMIILIFN